MRETSYSFLRQELYRCKLLIFMGGIKMKKKAIGIFVCILLMIIMLPWANAMITTNDTKNCGCNKLNQSLQVESSTIVCSNRYFFICDNVNSSGFVSYAKESALNDSRFISVWYYEEYGSWEYGNAQVAGLLSIGGVFPFIRIFDNHFYQWTLVVEIYGFQGETSWDGEVENANIWLNGSAVGVRVAYHGS